MKISNYEDLVYYLLSCSDDDKRIYLSIHNGSDLSDEMTPEFAEEVRGLLKLRWICDVCGVKFASQDEKKAHMKELRPIVP